MAKNKLKVYIAGKVTGLEYADVYNKFRVAELQLQAMGFEVWNPCEHISADCDWNQAMRTCLKALMDCDCIYLTHDWNQSKGATIERNLAKQLELEFITISEK